MSSDAAPNSMASAASAIRLPASGAQDMHAQHAIGLGVGENLHEAVRRRDGFGARVGA